MVLVLIEIEAIPFRLDAVDIFENVVVILIKEPCNKTYVRYCEDRVDTLVLQ